jgi:hypothetical protein
MHVQMRLPVARSVGDRIAYSSFDQQEEDRSEPLRHTILEAGAALKGSSLVRELEPIQ